MMNLLRTRFFHDPRDFQIAFLLAFLVLGVFARDFTVHWDCVSAALLSCVVMQLIADRFWQNPNPSIRSALISAISICLILRANSWMTIGIAGMLAILSKYVLRYKGKHFFNPSNFGIVLVLWLSKDAWVTPGQWGEEVWFAFLFVGAGLLVLRKVGRWDTTAVFLITYAILEASRNLYLGWTWDVFAHRFTSGSLLLFAFFMITDPRVIPDHVSGRIIFAFLVGVLTFVLRNYYFIPTAVFWSLFVLSPVTILLDRFWNATRFQWSLKTVEVNGR